MRLATSGNILGARVEGDVHVPKFGPEDIFQTLHSILLRFGSVHVEDLFSNDFIPRTKP